MGYRAVLLLLTVASFAVAQVEDLEYRVTALERLVSSITADFPQYFTQDGTTDYLEAADSCYKCEDEVAKLHGRISNQTEVISKLEKALEALRLRIEDLVNYVNGTENFIAHPEAAASYNDLAGIAQASCSALARSPHWVWAVPRDCHHGDGMTCDQACASMEQSFLSEVGGGRVECFDAFYVSRTALGLRTYHYLQDGGCSWQPDHCGPNYCCCRRFD